MVLKDNDYPFRRTLKKGKAMRVVHSAAAFASDASLPGTAVIRSGFKSNYAERTEPAVLPFPRPPQCAKDVAATPSIRRHCFSRRGGRQRVILELIAQRRLENLAGRRVRNLAHKDDIVR